MKLTREALKWPQIDAAMRFIYDNPGLYDKKATCDILEFGVGSARSAYKIIDYIKEIGFKNCSYYGFDAWSGLPAEADGVAVFEKFKPGSYKYDQPDEITLRQLLNFPNLYLYSTLFEKLDDIPYFDTNLTALLVHIDCDLYISSKQALDWCFKNNMICNHTLIAFDEYSSVENELAGEQKAWWEIRDQYEFKTNEIWHNTYYDKGTGQKIIQNVWEITSIG